MKWKFFIKLAISLVLIALVLRLVHPEELIKTLATVPAWVGLSVLLGYLTSQVLSAYKWQLLLHEATVLSSIANCIKAYFIGMFANCFGLGVVGGDLVRALLVGKGEQAKTEAFASVVADRVHGLAVLAAIGTVATALFGSNIIERQLFVLLLGIGVALTIGWFLCPITLRFFSRRLDKLKQKIDNVRAVFPTKGSIIISITLISISVHLIQIGLHKVIGIGLGVDIPWVVLLIVIPFVNILSSLPFSWNGLGVREVSYVFFFTSQFEILSQEQAVAVGAIWFVAVVLSSLIGGMVAFLTGDLAVLRKSPSV